MSYKKDRDEFIGQIVEETWTRKKGRGGSLNDAVDLAQLILRNASTIQRLAEAACNDELTAKQERQEAATRHRIINACKPWDIQPNFQGDPRGCCVKLLLPSGHWNGWGGKEDGFCVPVR